MALVEMKRVTLLAMLRDRDKLLRLMQRAGCVEITEAAEDGVEAYLSKDRSALEAADEKLSRIRWTLGQLGRFGQKESMLSQMSIPEAEADEAARVLADEAALMRVVAGVESCERRSGELRGTQARLHAELEQLKPWQALDIPVEKIHDTHDTVQFAGSVNKRGLDAFMRAMADLPVRMETIYETHDTVQIWLMAHKSVQAEVREALKAAEFAAAQFAAQEGTPRRQLEQVYAALDQVEKDRAALENTLRSMAEELPRLKILYELIVNEKERAQAGTRFLETGSTFLMRGWAPRHACEKLEKKLRAVSPDCAVEFRDATDDETPPTLMYNNRFAAPFEAVISNYSLPDPRGLDPTFIMAPFFACFFGMMVSDAGYGLIMAIAIPLIIRFVKPKPGLRKIMWVLAVGGVGTVFWGALYDGWFGVSLMPIFINPMEQPLEMMVVCMAVGAVHLLAGLGVGAYMNFKRGKPLDAVFDQFSWVALLFGLGMLLLPATRLIGAVLAIAGALCIVLTAGRDKPTFVKRIISGLGALYGVTSWLSDLLSYMRLFGMGLATGVIAMVFNMLAGMIIGKGIVGTLLGVALLVVGHTFNAAINVLGAYVHSCRLQYIEFFGKFYEDGGRPFRPLATNPRYVAIRESNADGVES